MTSVGRVASLFLRGFVVVLGVLGLISGSLIALESDASAVQGFSNAAVADKGLAEVGTSRPTGWNQPGECIVSVRRWVEAAGGSFPGGNGVIGGYTAAGATEMSLATAVKGDVIQYTRATGDYGVDNNDWTHVHTVVVVANHGNGRFHIVQSNSPEGSGLVTQVTDWAPSPAAGWAARVWRFGRVDQPYSGGSVGTSQPLGKDFLAADERLYPNQFLTSTDGRHVLILQGDGNLVLYGTGYAARWSSGTAGRSVHSLLMQGDGNLVLYGTGSQGALWSSGTAGRGNSVLRVQDDGNTVLRAGAQATWSTATPSGLAGLSPRGGDRLAVDERLYPNQFLRSADGRYFLAAQGDGNVVLYSAGYRVHWSTGTAGRSVHSLLMQGDGNLVLYGTGSQGALWSSNRTGVGTFSFILQNDGNSVIYGPGGPLWVTGTTGLI